MNNLTNQVYTTLNDMRTAFTIGSFKVEWYGIFFTIAFVVAIILACIKLEKWYKISCNPFYWFVFIGIPVSLIGARLWSFIIGDAAKLLAKENFFVAFFDFRQGGLAVEGGVMLTVIAAFIYFPLILRKPKYHVKTKIGKEFYVKQVSMWVYADAIVPCILIGQVIGRWGNFFNQEVYGPATTAEALSWLKAIMPGVYYGMDINGTFYQPFFLYESFINFWFFIGLYVGGEFIKKRKAGDLAICYFICYGLLRTCMEPFRSSDYKFDTSIVTSVLFLVFGIVLLICNHLVFAKHRDFKFLFFIRYNVKTFFTGGSLSIRFRVFPKKLTNSNNQKINSASKKNLKSELKKPNFYRKTSEIYYFNGC